jgi:HD-GYP domain-containing protein (c-di-GMP phosphodiesterase class II)
VSDQICIGSKILAVADVFLSMAGSRPYRTGLGIEAAEAELERGRGIIYDNEVVDAFLSLIRDSRYQLPIAL